MKWLVGAASITIVLAGVYFFLSEFLSYQASRKAAMERKCAEVRRMVENNEPLDGLNDAQLRAMRQKIRDCVEYLRSGEIALP